MQRTQRLSGRTEMFIKLYSTSESTVNKDLGQTVGLEFVKSTRREYR